MCTKMEQPFYPDSFLSGYGQDYKTLKSGMALNLSAEPFRGLKSQLPPHLRGQEDGPVGYFAVSLQQQQQQQAAESGSSSLKLAAPELERLIVQNSNGVITTTPTPPGQYYYPRGATEEQEGFADGFVKALDDLHKMNHMPPPNVSLGAAASAARLHQPDQLQPRRLAERPGGGRLPQRQPQLPAAAARADFAAPDAQLQRGAPDGAGRAEPARVAHQHGRPGAHQGGEEAAAEPPGRHQMPEEEAGAHRPPGGEGEDPEERERGTVQHGQRAPGPGGPAQAESHEPREQRLPAPPDGQDAAVLLKGARPAPLRLQGPAGGRGTRRGLLIQSLQGTGRQRPRFQLFSFEVLVLFSPLPNLCL